MRIVQKLLAAGGVIALAATSAQAFERPPRTPANVPSSSGGSSSSGGATPVDAPSHFALFALAAGGLIGGRMIARRRKKKD